MPIVLTAILSRKEGVTGNVLPSKSCISAELSATGNVLIVPGIKQKKINRAATLTPLKVVLKHTSLQP